MYKSLAQSVCDTVCAFFVRYNDVHAKFPLDFIRRMLYNSSKDEIFGKGH